MPLYNPNGSIIFSKEEKEALQDSAREAGITLEQQIKLLLVRGLPAVVPSGERCVVSIDPSLWTEYGPPRAPEQGTA